MIRGISASPSSIVHPPTSTQHKIKPSCCFSSYVFSDVVSNYNPLPKLRNSCSSSNLKHGTLQVREFGRLRVVVQCSRNNLPGGGGGSASGDNGSKNVLDAFFLGKALAEAINERIESTVGELLSTVGKLQAEQQKQVQVFQEEVLERAKKAKQKAAAEAIEAQGNIVNNSTSSSVSSKVVEVELSPLSSSAQMNNPNNNDPIIGMMMNDD